MQAAWQKFKTQLLKDKKKLGIMLGLSAILLVLWGRLALLHSGASAKATVTASDSSAQSAAPAQASQSTQNARAAQASGKVVSVRPATPLHRNLFAFDANGYRRAKDSNFGAIQAKSASKRTDEQVRLAAVRQAAAGLTLESVITGTQPRAVINGHMIAIGDTIHGFTLKKVLDRQAVLEMNGVVVRLGM